MPILQAVNLTKYYGNDPNVVKALNGVNLSVEKGEFLSIVGTSGSGKSTLLHILGGLDNPTSGKVFIENKDIYLLNDTSRAIFRRRNVGFVFQNYNMIPILNIYENVILPVKLDGNDVDKDFLDEIFSILKLNDRLDFLPHQLSGGQRQRAAIARALITKPAIIFADEPTGNLDNKTSQEVMGLFKISSNHYNQTIIMITHDEEIAQLSDRIIRIEDGIIV